MQAVAGVRVSGLRVVARCGARRPAIATLVPRSGVRKHKATVRQSADSTQVLCDSCNGESSGLSLLSVACVNHELHARKIRGPR